MVVSAPSEHTKKDFKSTFESNEKKDVPLIFRCSFQVVDDQMKGNESLLEIWNEYKPFLEFLTGKVEACIEKYGESEAKGYIIVLIFNCKLWNIEIDSIFALHLFA